MAHVGQVETRESQTAGHGAPAGDADEPRGRLAGLRLALGRRTFRYYWLGLFGLAFALDIQRFTFPWLAYHLTDSKLMVGLMAFCLGIPNVLLSPFGGVLADRAGRDRVIRTTQLLGVLASGSLAALLLAGVLPIWGVMLFAAVIGSIAAFDQPARQAIVPALVPREALINAMALTSSVWSSARIVGPAIGGVALAVFVGSGVGPGGVFLLAAAGYGAMLLCMTQVRLPRPPARARDQSFLRAMAEGFRYILSRPLVLALFLVLFGNSVFGMSFVVLMPVFAREVYGVDERGLGVLVAAYGVGALVGTVTLAAFGGSRRRGWVLLAASAGFGISLALFSRSTSLLVSLPLLLAAGTLSAWYQTAAHTLLQVIVPDAVRGRVMANYTLIWSLAPLGGTLMGATAEVAGAPAAVLGGGLIIVLLSVACATLRPEVRALD